MHIEIHSTHPQERKVRQAVDLLRRDGVLLYPTDTVYALGCDIFARKAIPKLHQIKQMAKEHPLSLICHDLSNISKYAVVDDFAYRLMRRLVPGPYTFVLRATREVPKLLLRRQKTVGIRVPDHSVTLALVKELGHPIVSTSAKLGEDQVVDPRDIPRAFQMVDAVVDSGWGGLDPSTVIDLVGDHAVVLREGAGPVDTL